MKIAVASALAVAVSATTVLPGHMTAFKDFQLKYGKTYEDDAEWAKRLGIFAANFEKVVQDNREHMFAGGSAVFGITKFMDLTPEEFKSIYLTYKPSSELVKRVAVTTDGPLAESVDWRTKDAVTPVKDQGQCGSCWAFSATEAIESYNFLAGNKLVKLSAQQITSCDSKDLGCNGGNTETAYKYVEKAGGLALQSDYPYVSGGGDGGTCKRKVDKAVKISGFTSVQKGENHLATALNHGPVSVCLAAEAFQSYNSGILKRCNGQVDHCVQAVGYGSENGVDYWLVRNSWGTVWGEQGYIRIERGSDLCKISSDVTFPTF